MMKKRSKRWSLFIPKRQSLLQLCICYAAVGILSLIIILGLRGVMNVWSRMDSILKRLDGYPQLYDSYQKELQEWDNWWINENMQRYAEEASVIYRYLDSPESESEKLEYIARLLYAEEARIIPSDFSSVPTGSYYIDESSGSITCISPVDYERYISLRFLNNVTDYRLLSSEITDSFIRRVEAGLPGHIIIQHNGELSVYPRDEEGAALQQMVGEMLSRGELDPEKQRKQAEKDKKTSSVSWQSSILNAESPERRYFLYSCAYTENPDYVIGVVPVSEMLRLAGKRSWSLWFLFMALIILLGVFLWRTSTHPSTRNANAKSIKAKHRLLLSASLMLLIFSILYIQQMSAVSQSEQSAADEAAFLKYMLKDEESRRNSILEDYDFMHTDRVATLASLLSDHPEMSDPYILYQLDLALGGSGLRITGLTGNPISSDRAFIQSASQDEQTDSGGSLTERVYKAPIVDEQDFANSIVQLSTLQRDIDDLLKETEPKDVIKELTLLDTLHILAVDHDQRDVITASTNENWIGDDPKEHDVNTAPFYDGYEGLISFDGQSCYSVVFQHKNTLVAVGSEPVSVLVYLGGVFLLLIPLTLLLLFAIYKPVVKAARMQKLQMPEAVPDENDMAQPGIVRNELSPLRLIHGYMVAFFIHSAILYVVTNGNSSGLTYHLVRGTWRHGVNAITVTTCIILASMVFTLYLVLELLLRYLSRYLSQRGKTISQLLINAAGYICTIAVILYTLSMFGMNTATLVGGVGAAALVFTLGANSLISDVLSGLFIIFDGDYVIGDRVEIDSFIGVVTDISIRNTSLESTETHEVKIIRNSMVKELVNRSKHIITNYLDFQIGRGVDLKEAEKRINSVLDGLDQKYPQLVGKPFFGGVSALPEIKPPGIPLELCTVCVGYSCLDSNNVLMAYAIREELLSTVNDLLFSPTDNAFHVRVETRDGSSFHSTMN